MNKIQELIKNVLKGKAMRIGLKGAIDVDRQDTQNAAQISEAIQYFEKAFKETDLSKQIELYSKAIEINPQFIEAYYNRGCAKDSLGQYELAIANFNRVIDLNPQDAEIYYYRGNAKLKLGLNESAEEDYAKAKELGYIAQ
jgi:tetratricopeptide (TPR) repeat protein